MADPVIQRNDESQRYEARIDGELAGFAQFQLTDSLVLFPHTEVDPLFEGLGVGSALAQYALDDVRREGTRKVVPRCPFIRGWIVRHPEYDELIYRAPQRLPEGGS